MMTETISIAPTGRLFFEHTTDSPDELPATTRRLVQQAFERSPADGLLCLASRKLDGALPASLVFWRAVSRDLFQTLCHYSGNDGGQWPELPPPSREQLEPRLAAAPPMRGLEYLTVELLQQLWLELRQRVIDESREFDGSAVEYLQSVNPVWRLLGRVTFHLAENKGDPQRPFAFMATYAHRVSDDARLKHLPLAQALRDYAGAKNREALSSLLSPVSQAAEQSELVRELLDSKAIFQPQAWSIRQAHRLLTEVPRLEDNGLVVRVPDWWRVSSPPRPQVEVRVGQKKAQQLDMDSMLDFSLHVALDGQPLSQDELQQIMQSTEGLMLLRGKWVEVDRDQLQQALDHWQQLEQENPDGLSFVKGMRLLAGAGIDMAHAADDEATPVWSKVEAGDWLRKTLQKIRDPAGIKQALPGRELRATLRPYQQEGVRWLRFMNQLGLGACLADDMGLGKTIQVLALLLLLRHDSRSSPAAPSSRAANARNPASSLLVVPASLIGNWKQEIERFAPSLRVFYAHRSETDAKTLEQVGGDPQRLDGFDLAITTYGLLRRLDWPEQVSWRLVILDEAQAIKNAGSAQTRAVKKLPAGGRIALTGTPVENHLGDLWSLFDFCCPGLLGSAAQFKSFVKRLAERQDAAAFGPLRRLVRPYILRRLKTDPAVIPDLPDKTEMRTECPLTKKQAVLYQRAVDELEKRLQHADGIARRGLVLAALMQFKQICNHPSQFLGQQDFPPRESGKLLRLEELCDEIADRQEKVLVFTQFRAMTEPLAEFLRTVFEHDGLVLHGGTAVRKRQSLVRAFQEDHSRPFMVISVKAGGSGLNLTAASHVIHFDRWWNPAVENQATDRAFRIGQTKNVLVHKFVCRGTVEERIDRMIADKQQLSDQLLSDGAETALTELSDDELINFVSLDINRATASE